MTVPNYAGSMILNYRAMFKKKYGYETNLDDGGIYKIINEIYDDSSTESQDLWRVETMKEREA